MKEKEYHGLGYVWHNLEYLLAAVFATIMLIALFVQVVARFVFNNPIGWTEELAVTSFVMMVYIGSIGATRDDSHLKLELFINMASPKGKQVLLIVGDIVFSLMNLLLSYGLLNVTINLKKYGLTTAMLQLPKWIPYSVLIICFLAMDVRLVQNIIERVHIIKGLKHPEISKESEGQ